MRLVVLECEMWGHGLDIWCCGLDGGVLVARVGLWVVNEGVLCVVEYRERAEWGCVE